MLKKKKNPSPVLWLFLLSITVTTTDFLIVTNMCFIEGNTISSSFPKSKKHMHQKNNANHGLRKTTASSPKPSWHSQSSAVAWCEFMHRLSAAPACLWLSETVRAAGIFTKAAECNPSCPFSKPVWAFKQKNTEAMVWLIAQLRWDNPAEGSVRRKARRRGRCEDFVLNVQSSLLHRGPSIHCCDLIQQDNPKIEKTCELEESFSSLPAYSGLSFQSCTYKAIRWRGSHRSHIA